MKQIITDKKTGAVLGVVEGSHQDTALFNYHAVTPDIDLSNLNNYMEVNGVLTLDVTAALDKVKAKKSDEMKQNATQAILATNWRLERAKERALTGATGETVDAVLLEREAIRQASNRIDAAIKAAKSVAKVNAIIFEVLPKDYITKTVLSRVDFMNRFTQLEMEAITTAAKTSPPIETMLLKWQAADSVNLASQETQMTVNALETAGIIKTGRAAVILKP